MKPKVSIVILIYMVEKYLEKCIESVISQSYDNVEVILSVKRGNDLSYEICEKYAQQHSNIKIVDRKESGRGQGRNDGMAVVTGEYVLFVDGDDWMESTMVEKLVSSITKHDADLAVCGDTYEYENNPLKTEVHIARLPEVFGKKEFYRELMRRKSFGVEVWNKLYKFAIIKDIPFGEEQAEDRFWSTKAFEKVNTITYVPSPEFHYIVRGDSASRKPHIMESSLQADCILVDNIKAHGYLKLETSCYIFNSCIAALYAAIHFGYFTYASFSSVYKIMKSVYCDVIRFGDSRVQDKIKAFFTGLGYHPIVWLLVLYLYASGAGVYDDDEKC